MIHREKGGETADYTASMRDIYGIREKYSICLAASAGPAAGKVTNLDSTLEEEEEGNKRKRFRCAAQVQGLGLCIQWIVRLIFTMRSGKMVAILTRASRPAWECLFPINKGEDLPAETGGHGECKECEDFRVHQEVGTVPIDGDFKNNF